LSSDIDIFLLAQTQLISSIHRYRQEDLPRFQYYDFPAQKLIIILQIPENIKFIPKGFKLFSFKTITAIFTISNV